MPLLATCDPLSVVATLDHKKEMRLKLERLPILVDGMWFDMHGDSSEYIRRMLNHWDMLGISTRRWRLQDNSSADVTKTQLEAVDLAVTVRGGTIFDHYETIVADTSITLRHLNELSNWGLDPVMYQSFLLLYKTS